MELPVYEELVDDEGKSRTTKQYGSKGAAAALLAHLYAWRATIEEQLEYLVEAERYCTMIIENQAGELCLGSFTGSRLHRSHETWQSLNDLGSSQNIGG